MKRPTPYLSLLISCLCFSCQPKTNQIPMEGTWELIAATTRERDSTFSTFDTRRSMIKLLNSTHFAFLNHTLDAKKDSAAAPFSAGGGTYTLVDSTYTEHLNYYVDPAWEQHVFTFTVKIDNDTLTQTGLEKVEELGIERVIVEKYKRVKTPYPID